MTKKVVLVVDDEPGYGETLQDILSGHGFDVHIAMDGREGLDMLKQLPAPPCIVILDLMMPRMDGNTFYRTVRADPDPELSKVAVLVTTSDPSRAPSGVLLMRKPVDIDVLVGTVNRCCPPIGVAS